MSDYRVTFRDQAGRERTLDVCLERVHRPSALRRLWRERGDYIVICGWFLVCFVASLKVTGWF